MISYKNTTEFTKTLYGVKFKPGETYEVPGYINIPGFVPSIPEVTASDAPATNTVQTSTSKKSSTKSTVKSTTEEV